MNELEKVLNFEGQEIKVKTNDGKTIYNLVHTAKGCGLFRTKGNNKLVRWDDIKKKFNNIYCSIESSTPQYIEEIQYILDEIDNSDDRNSIYISSWLAKRLATECNSESAHKFKNFLVTMDEKRENGELININNSELSQFNVMANQFMNMTNTMSSTMVQLGQAFNGIQTFVKDSIQAKDHQISYIENIIGVRDVNVKKLSKNLKLKVEERYKKKVWATTKEYKEAKENLFRTFDITAWEQIPVLDYNKINTYISNL
jgi:hypothetical protein